MKKKHLLYLLFIFNCVTAQTITFISEKSAKPLPKVSVFGKDGSILAYSDIDGKIDKKALSPEQEKFKIVYDNFAVATLSYVEIDKDIIRLNDQVKEIEAIVIKNTKPAKYIYVKGNFNAYVTVNNKLNSYADGIVIYTFDNKTKKLKNTMIQQYRVFSLQNPGEDRKKTALLDYSDFLEIQKIKYAGTLESYKKDQKMKFRELKGDLKDEVEFTEEHLQKKEFGFLGYRFFDFRDVLQIAYEKDSEKALKNLLSYSSLEYFKFRHKSEPALNAIVVYNNFYPEEISFNNDNESEKVRFSTNNSNYTQKYWEDSTFPNMQTIFSSFFKDDLKEQQNKK